MPFKCEFERRAFDISSCAVRVSFIPLLQLLLFPCGPFGDDEFSQVFWLLERSEFSRVTVGDDSLIDEGPIYSVAVIPPHGACDSA